MTEADIFPAAPRDVTGASIEVAREALGRFAEAARQAHNVLGQSADVIASGVQELHEKAVRHAEEQLQLSLGLAQRLTEAAGLEAALDAQKEFAEQTAEAYARQVQELSRLMTQFAPKASPEASFE
jgi:hypothetical protein